MYASATASYCDIENSRVMLTLRPASRLARTAGTPSFVPGILIMTFGRSTAAKMRCASAIVPWVS